MGYRDPASVCSSSRLALLPARCDRGHCSRSSRSALWEAKVLVTPVCRRGLGKGWSSACADGGGEGASGLTGEGPREASRSRRSLLQLRISCALPSHPSTNRTAVRFGQGRHLRKSRHVSRVITPGRRQRKRHLTIRPEGQEPNSRLSEAWPPTFPSAATTWGTMTWRGRPASTPLGPGPRTARVHLGEKASCWMDPMRPWALRSRVNVWTSARRSPRRSGRWTGLCSQPPTLDP
jgi:hypothetical protein